MDQIKIGRFIAEKRKEQKMTQVQLAEKLGITDRAVSKWETGKSLPDASIMLELCGLLGITVNDLLSGEVVSMNNYNDKMEKNLIEAVRGASRQKAAFARSTDRHDLYGIPDLDDSRGGAHPYAGLDKVFADRHRRRAVYRRYDVRDQDRTDSGILRMSGLRSQICPVL